AMDIDFSPSADVTAIINALLDIFERRGGAPRQAVRIRLDDLAEALPGYYDQLDPTPRTTANEQLATLERQGLLRLAWQPGQTDHLLDGVGLEIEGIERLYELVGRQPLAEQRRRLRELLLAHRSHLSGWRQQAVEACLRQLKARKSPAPFSLTDVEWNGDLLAALMALPDEEIRTEMPYRVFSVRVFNNSKRFETLKDALARLARRHQPLWRNLSLQDTLREMGLVANPGHLYLYGPWRLIDVDGQVVSLAEFYPSVGIPAALAARIRRATVDAPRLVCVENLASFYELVRHEGQSLAALCLWGNPSPAARHLLRCLVETLPPQIPLLLWADIDYGGLNILAQLRRQVSPRFAPYRMDPATLDAHARWGHPLSASDARNLNRLRQHPALGDMLPLIDHMLLREIKLEQEAVVIG
ncbi:MAG: Wadjet anti-phage system protein JetD domain-containing protein, partial [Anaerolineae bacterium]